MLPVYIFSRGDIFSGEVELFSGGGGWLRNFQGGHMLETPTPPGNILLLLKTEEVQKKRMGDDTC